MATKNFKYRVSYRDSFGGMMQTYFTEDQHQESLDLAKRLRKSGELAFHEKADFVIDMGPIQESTEPSGEIKE